VHLRDGARRPPQRRQHPVGRFGEVARRVDERAVEVYENGADHTCEAGIVPS